MGLFRHNMQYAGTRRESLQAEMRFAEMRRLSVQGYFACYLGSSRCMLDMAASKHSSILRVTELQV